MNNLPKTIFCLKLNQEAEALERPPYPGELGQRLWQQISKPAWQGWLGHQTMLINEYRLNLLDRTARSFLAAEMEKYFFGSGSATPEKYVPTE